MSAQKHPRIVIIGAGFGGLYAARTLANKPVDVLVIDRDNYHTFTPLLYQVATCALDPSDIAYPVRSIFRRTANVNFLLGEVTAIDYAQQQIEVRGNGRVSRILYDYLIIATGSRPNYFGNKKLAEYAFVLKTVGDAVVLRNHILKVFEKAAWTDDPDDQAALLTLVVVGGGPTGLETAGALYELYNHVLRNEFAGRKTLRARVLLLEAMDRILLPYPDTLQKAAIRQLESLGVEVRLNAMVETVARDHVVLKDGSTIPTHTLVWSAGVKASPVGEMLGVALQRVGRVPVTPTLEVIGRENIYAIGDIAYLEDPKGEPYPMLIPVANQQGALAARNILNRLEHKPQVEFAYKDKGIMATIGRRRAVAWLFYRIRLTGFIAWLAWLVFHLITLLGFRNRVSVFLSWVWNYFTYDRSVRIILEHSPHQVDLPDPRREPEVTS